MLYTKLKHKTKEIKELTKLGLISPNWLRDLSIFEEFHSMDGCYLCKCEIIGDKYKVSSSLVEKVVRKMKAA